MSTHHTAHRDSALVPCERAFLIRVIGVLMEALQVWSVNINIFVLDHNGNLIDCASIAAVTALLHFRRPEVAVNGDEVTLFKPADREPVPLSIHHIPIAISFALFDAGYCALTLTLRTTHPLSLATSYWLTPASRRSWPWMAG